MEALTVQDVGCVAGSQTPATFPGLGAEIPVLADGNKVRISPGRECEGRLLDRQDECQGCGKVGYVQLGDTIKELDSGNVGRRHLPIHRVAINSPREHVRVQDQGKQRQSCRQDRCVTS
eukprot:2919335-Rhodomonas_salina.1